MIFEEKLNYEEEKNTNISYLGWKPCLLYSRPSSGYHGCNLETPFRSIPLTSAWSYLNGKRRNRQQMFPSTMYRLKRPSIVKRRPPRGSRRSLNRAAGLMLILPKDSLRKPTVCVKVASRSTAPVQTLPFTLRADSSRI